MSDHYARKLPQSKYIYFALVAFYLHLPKYLW